MHQSYSDITDKLGEPKWWDEYAVPRYCEFSPEMVANIYARTIVLLEIACQNCGHHFEVCMSQDRLQEFTDGYTLEEAIKTGSIHYGDPPFWGCCGPGPSMNCVDLRVLEFWYQPSGPLKGWVRRFDLGGELSLST